MLKKLVLLFAVLCCLTTNSAIKVIYGIGKQIEPIIPVFLLGVENSLIDKAGDYVPNTIKEPCNNFINFLNEKITINDYGDPGDRAGMVTFSSITKTILQSGINTLLATKYLQLNPIQSFCFQLLNTDIKVSPVNEFLINILGQVPSIIFSCVLFSNDVKNVIPVIYNKMFDRFGYSFIYGSLGFLESLPFLTIQNFLVNNVQQNEQAERVEIIQKAKARKNAMFLLYLLGLFSMKYYFFKKSNLNIHWKSLFFTAAVMAIDYKTNATINLKNYIQIRFNTIIEENTIFNSIPAQLILLIYTTNIIQNVLQNYKPKLRYSISQPVQKISISNLIPSNKIL